MPAQKPSRRPTVKTSGVPAVIGTHKCISVPLPCDYHWHARQGPMFHKMHHHTVKRCGRALLMPNTVKGMGLFGPIADVNDLKTYYRLVESHMDPCEPLMTIKLLKSTTPETIRRCHTWGAVAAKLYPEGATTNSHDGIPVSWLEMDRYKDGIAAGGSTGTLLTPNQSFLDVLAEMERVDMVLCLHGEMPNYASYTGDDSLTAVRAFLDFVDYLIYQFPKLRIVLEHISTKQEVDMVKQWYNLRNGRVAATVTAHHLEFTVNEVVGRNYNYCRPPAQYHFDRMALTEFVTSGHPAAILGTDSAAHPKYKKECAECCAGVFSAPTFLEYLTGVFDTRDAMRHIEGFFCKHGDEFYGLKPLNQFIKMAKREWLVPDDYDGLRPFMAGQKLAWSLS